jgi:hypothetical protein
VECFSEICKQYESIHLANTEHEELLWPKIPPIKPPDVKRLMKTAIQRIEKPYKIASTFTIPFLIASVSLCTMLIVVSFYMLFAYQTFVWTNQLPLLLLSMLFNTIGLFMYVSLTFRHINGGEYIQGIWLISYSTMGGLIFCLLSMIVKDRVRTTTRFEYQPISDLPLTSSSVLLQAPPKDIEMVV